MKVILLEDIKGKGKRNDIIDVANGYANHLISNKSAVQATEDNLKNRDFELAEAKALDDNKREVAERVAYIISHVNNFVVNRTSTPKGTTNRSVTKDDIIRLLNIAVPDYPFYKTNLKMDTIKTFGFHYIEVKLYKDIRTVIRVRVEE